MSNPDAARAPFPGPGGDIYAARASGLIPAPTPVRLWVDARQPAPGGWYWVTSSRQALRLLEMARSAGLEIRECSLSHDLDPETAQSAEPTDTTRPVVQWMCENDYFPRILRVHHAKRDDRQWLESVLGRHAPTGCLRRL